MQLRGREPEVLEAVRPIVFGAESIHGIEEGLKTQTRRLGLPRPPNEHLGYMMLDGGVALMNGPDHPDGADDEVRCHLGKPGDVLWVREAWAPVAKPPVRAGVFHPKCITNPKRGEPGEKIAGATWKAAWMTSEGVLGNPSGYTWHSSRFMPKWVARMFVRIDKIRVQRLQNISEKDALAEGIRSKMAQEFRKKPFKVYLGAYSKKTEDLSEHKTAVLAYASLWDSINAKRNPPRVWIYENGKKRVGGWEERKETPDLPWCCWAAGEWIWVIDFSVAWRYGMQTDKEK